jgi:hypothetical protein
MVATDCKCRKWLCTHIVIRSANARVTAARLKEDKILPATRSRSARPERDLMAWMGHNSERAAMMYQHVARGADQLITNAIDAHVQGEQRKDDGDEDSSDGILIPCGLMARKINNDSRQPWADAPNRL